MRLAGISLSCIVLMLPFAVSAGVSVNEVAWMGSLPKTGESSTQASNNEWLELYNSSASPVDLTGWGLSAYDGVPNIVLSGTISADGFFLLERTSDDTVLGITADQIYTGALGNSGEHLLLKDASGNSIDEIDASLGWMAGDNSTKDTMQRVGAVWISASSTPRKINQGVSSSSASPSPSEASSSETSSAPSAMGSDTSIPYLPPATIRAYAGDDQIVSVGSVTTFRGRARGINDEPLENARFWWNFGDGASAEARVATYIFRIPGTYLAGLHVSSGSFAASDFATITVIPNQVSITSVIPGEDGYVRLANSSAHDLDIGAWSIIDAGGRVFTFPSATRIKGKSDIAIANGVTGLFKESNPPVSFVIRYPNSKIALEWHPDGVASSVPAVQDVSSKRPSAPSAVVLSESASPRNISVPSVSVRLVPESSSASSTGTAEHASLGFATGRSGTFFFVAAVSLGIFVSVAFLIFKTIL